MGIWWGKKCLICKILAKLARKYIFFIFVFWFWDEIWSGHVFSLWVLLIRMQIFFSDLQDDSCILSVKSSWDLFHQLIFLKTIKMIFLEKMLLWWSLQRDPALVTDPELHVSTSLVAFSREKNIGVDFCSQGDYITQQHFSISVLSCEKQFHRLHFSPSCHVISFHSCPLLGSRTNTRVRFFRKEPQIDTPQSVIHRFILYPLNLNVYLNLWMLWTSRTRTAYSPVNQALG